MRNAIAAALKACPVSSLFGERTGNFVGRLTDELSSAHSVHGLEIFVQRQRFFWTPNVT
jgi:hypothetical protein